MQVQAPSASSKWLLSVMASLSRPPAHRVFASAATMAAITQLDRKTVLSSTIALEAAGLIRRTGEKAGRGGAPVFTLPVELQTDTENGSGSGRDDLRTKPKNGSGSFGTSTENGIGSENASDRTDTKNGSASDAEPNPKAVSVPANRTQKRDTYTKREEIKRTHTRKSPPVASPPPLLEVEPQTLADWETVRKAKRAGPITATVVKLLRTQAAQAGISLQDAVEYCCGRGWQNFNAGWYANASTQPGTGAGPTSRSTDLWSGAK